MTHRKQQIDYTLDRRIRKAHVVHRNRRESESAIVRAWKRIRHLPIDYDSEEEAIKVRKARDRADKTEDDWRGGVHRGKENDEFLDNVELWRRPRVMLGGFVKIPGEPTDVGEECRSLAKSFRRASRRLQRWGETGLPGQAVISRRMTIDRGIVGGRDDLSIDRDGDGFEEERMPAPPPVKAGTKRRRSAKAQAGPRKARNRVKKEVQVEAPEPRPEPEMDEEQEDEDGDRGMGGGGGGAAELDEEDREMLGEVDADMSEEDEDEDEDMDD
jgi:Ino eighty subunit 1